MNWLDRTNSQISQATNESPFERLKKLGLDILILGAAVHISSYAYGDFDRKEDIVRELFFCAQKMLKIDLSSGSTVNVIKTFSS